MPEYKSEYIPSTADTAASPSPAIWGKVPLLDFSFGDGGFLVHEDFLTFPDVATNTTVTDVGLWEILTENGTGTLMHAQGQTATGTLADMGGILNLVAGTTADIDVVAQYGGGGAFMVSDTAADAKKLWFEARFKISTIADGVSSFFVGLAEPDRTVTNGVFSDAHAISGIGAIGFARLDADGDGLDAVYVANGQSPQTSIDSMATLVADTWVKAGFIYDPSAIATQRIKWFLNGVKQTTYVTGTNIEAATFPDAEILTPTFGIKNDDGSTASTLEVDWVRVAQER